MNGTLNNLFHAVDIVYNSKFEKLDSNIDIIEEM